MHQAIIWNNAGLLLLISAKFESKYNNSVQENWLENVFAK